jgi:D-threo-aldose 1-dehydrogenase
MLCTKFGVELPAAALQFPLREPVVRSLVLGATEPAHIEQNVVRVAEPIPAALWEELAAEGFLP